MHARRDRQALLADMAAAVADSAITVQAYAACHAGSLQHSRGLKSCHCLVCLREWRVERELLSVLQVEASQSMIRIVGLSATLPNYKDVATFLGVNVDTGLFYFDASYRPVPLEMQFVGVTEKNLFASKNIMDEVCYEKVCPVPSCHLQGWVWQRLQI